MKFFNGIRLSAKKGIILWVAIHAILIILGLSVPWKMDSDLYSILPDSNEIKNVSAAEKFLSARSVRNISVLVGHENFDVARSAAVALDSLFKSDSSFEETHLFVNEKTMDETREFFFNHRYTLQGRTIREMLAKGDFESLKNRALQKIYGSFSTANLNHLDEDPFLLGDAAFENFVQNSPMAMSRFSIREGVLYAIDSGVTYVMWNAVLSEKVSSMASDGSDCSNAFVDCDCHFYVACVYVVRVWKCSRFYACVRHEYHWRKYRLCGAFLCQLEGWCAECAFEYYQGASAWLFDDGT